MDFKLLTSTRELLASCNSLRNAEWLALDTEFIREKTYYPVLCLVQLASEQDLICIDAIAIQDLSALKKLLSQTSIVKIFHSASQDLEIFVNLFDAVPTPVFDTQIAAGFLGYGDQISYAQLVEKVCDKKLDKSLSRSHWERRPLPEKALRYAIDDVKYLAEVYLHLKTQLDETKRTAWAEHECTLLSKLERYKVDLDEIWKTVKGTGRLHPQQLNLLRQLAKWRELQAIAENKPRRWVLSDPLLRALSVAQPTDMSALADVKDFNHEHIGYADALLETVEQARSIPEQNWPRAATWEPLTHTQRKFVRQVQALIRARATQLNISPSLLATRSVVEKLIVGEQESELLSGWKKDLIADELLHFIETNKPT